MAGILVSGGTYSGSGDVTTDWFICDDAGGGVINTVYMPDGVLDCVSENASDYTFNVGNTTYFYHSSGTIRISNPASSYVYMRGKSGLSSDRYPWNVQISGAMAAADRTMHPASSGWEILNDLTVNTPGGCYSRQGGSIKDLTVANRVLITSGTLTAHEADDASPATNTFGSLIIGAKGVYDATSGTTSITSKTSEDGLDHMALDNSAGGTFTHNSGTVSFDLQDTYQNIKMGGQWLYN